MSRYNIGIRYCGGCNPAYDRSRLVAQLLSRFPEIAIQYDPECYCALWIVVNGCLTGCADSSRLPGDEICVIRQPSDLKQAVQKIQELIDRGNSGESGDSDAQPAGGGDPRQPEDGNAQQSESREAQKRMRPKIAVGAWTSLTHTFTEEEVCRFAELTQDASRMHLDRGFARTTLYHRPVVHGVFVSSLLSGVMGTELPGEGTVLLEESVRYLAPVYPGETVCAEIRVTGIQEYPNHYCCLLQGVCTKEDHTRAVEAEYRQLLLKRLFPPETVQVEQAPMEQKEEKS
ncbi:MAG: MaoC family dehydratase [Eubacterium sp.]|jgi:acyl dehydratase